MMLFRTSWIISMIFKYSVNGAPAESLKNCEPLDPEICPLQWALEHRPFFHFDVRAENSCFPDEATNYNNGKCNKFNVDAPVYYKIIRCGDFLKLAWHLWYGLQKGCDPLGVDDGHDDDWEHITINFVRNGNLWEQDSVTYSQHGGFYTRNNKQQHPDVYVGRVAHGHYDSWCDNADTGWSWWSNHNYCTGICGYWEDFRLDNEQTRWMPTNIKHISEVKDDQVNRVTKYKYFDLEEKHSCDGVPWRCVGALTFCACWRNNHVFHAPICDI